MWRQTSTLRERPCEHEGRDRGDSTSQGMSEIVSNVPEARGKAWKRSSLTDVRRNQLC